MQSLSRASSAALRAYGRHSSGGALRPSRRMHAYAAPARGLATAAKDGYDGPESADDVEDMLAGKASGEDLRRAFMARSAAAVRYDYFAQRAELEAELEAATTFRSLKSVAEQQALGFLELLEEYGAPSDAAEGLVTGSTLDNVAGCALAERRDADVYGGYAENAQTDQLDQLSEWMTDMSDASARMADRLELVSGLMDSEFADLDGGDAGEAESKA